MKISDIEIIHHWDDSFKSYCKNPFVDEKNIKNKIIEKTIGDFNEPQVKEELKCSKCSNHDKFNVKVSYEDFADTDNKKKKRFNREITCSSCGKQILILKTNEEFL